MNISLIQIVFLVVLLVISGIGIFLYRKHCNRSKFALTSRSTPFGDEFAVGGQVVANATYLFDPGDKVFLRKSNLSPEDRSIIDSIRDNSNGGGEFLIIAAEDKPEKDWSTLGYAQSVSIAKVFNGRILVLCDDYQWLAEGVAPILTFKSSLFIGA